MKLFGYTHAVNGKDGAKWREEVTAFERTWVEEQVKNSGKAASKSSFPTLDEEIKKINAAASAISTTTARTAREKKLGDDKKKRVLDTA